MSRKSYSQLIVASYILLALILISCKNGEDKKGDIPQRDQKTSEVTKESKNNISPEEEQRLLTFLRKTMGSRLPSGTSIEVSGLEDSSIDGLKEGLFAVSSPRGSSDVKFLISVDGRYIILGEATNIENFEDSPVKGLKTGNLPAGGQNIPVVITDDGKHIVFAELLDTSVDPLRETMSKISLDGLPIKGDGNAMVTVVEYSDFQCPFCKRAGEFLPKILEEYKGKVKVVFKQLPLPMHKWAMDGAIASICAQQQGNEKFWEYHDLLFEKQREITEKNSEAEFKQIAEDIGLNTDEFDKCIGSPEVAQRVQNEMNEARSIGVSSTPTFIVNGMVVPGANLEGIKSAIEVSLSEN